jgi:hypothetical protein
MRRCVLALDCIPHGAAVADWIGGKDGHQITEYEINSAPDRVPEQR